MKINNYLLEIIVSALLIAALLACLNPLNLLMPPPILMGAVVALLLIFGLFSIYVWKERKGDERESYHKILSGHFAFLTGNFILVIAIAYQELNHQLDPWLIYTLIAMVVAKLISQYFNEKNN